MDEKDTIVLVGKDATFKIYKANIALIETSKDKKHVNLYLNSGFTVSCNVDNNGALVFDRIFK